MVRLHGSSGRWLGGTRHPRLACRRSRVAPAHDRWRERPRVMGRRARDRQPPGRRRPDRRGDIGRERRDRSIHRRRDAARRLRGGRSSIRAARAPSPGPAPSIRRPTVPAGPRPTVVSSCAAGHVPAAQASPSRPPRRPSRTARWRTSTFAGTRAASGSASGSPTRSDPEIGRLSLYHVDPDTGALSDLDGAPVDVQALPGFSIGDGRLAWATPPGQGGEGSRIQIAAWDGDTVGTVESVPGEDIIVVR